MVTGMPIDRKFIAMPPPIAPAPTMPTRPTGMRGVSGGISSIRAAAASAARICACTVAGSSRSGATPRLRSRIILFLHDSENLEQTGSAHSAGAAHRHNGKTDAAPLAFVHQMADAARTGHAVGMTDRDRAAGDVEPFVGNSEPVAAVEQLRRKRL